jgi:bacillopeptidase F
MPVNDPLLEENSQYFSYNGWHRGKDVNALNGDFIQSQDSNASLNVPQGATDITIFTREGPDQGIVEIDVDGTIVKRMDLYSPTETWNVKIKTALLPTAKKVTVIAANAKNPASTDTFITFDGYQFTPDIFHHDDLELVNWPNTANLQTNTETYRASMRKGSVILKFSGQQITWNTYHGPEAGIAEVYIDGELAQTIDLYNATPDWNTPVSFTHLLYGKHTIEIVVTGTKNTASSNYWVVMDSLDIE